MTNMATQWENSVIKFIVQKITKTSLSFSNKTTAVRSKKILLSRPCSIIVRCHLTSNTSSLFNRNLFTRRSFQSHWFFVSEQRSWPWQISSWGGPLWRMSRVSWTSWRRRTSGRGWTQGWRGKKKTGFNRFLILAVRNVNLWWTTSLSPCTTGSRRQRRRTAIGTRKIRRREKLCIGTWKFQILSVYQELVSPSF